jgi:extracellular matrix protein 14
LNVDGYDYSWSTDRLWRKNRQPTPVPFCTGIDPDRSWSYMWDTSPSNSPNPCSESPPPTLPTNLTKTTNLIGYRGEHPFQAIESQLLAKYIHTTLPGRGVTPIGYIDFHSYSQMILYPFAYDCDVLPRDAENLAEAAWEAARAARNVHGRYFDVDSACEADPHQPTRKTKSKTKSLQVRYSTLYLSSHFPFPFAS